MDVRSIAAILTTAALATVGAGAATTPTAHAAPPPPTPVDLVSCTGTPTNAFPDFDASGGAPDIVTGVPGEDVEQGSNAGAVEVRYGGDPVQPTQGLVLDDPVADDRFGAAVTAAHVDDDACDDLLVGVPGRDVGEADGIEDAGAVAVFLGSDDGLRFSALLVQGENGIPGEPLEYARFGEAMDAFTDTMVIGAPGKDVDDAIGAGAVVELTTDERNFPGLGFAGSELTQDSPGIPDEAETGDRWGSAISVYRDDFTAGAPGETIDGSSGAGAVIDRTDGTYSFLSQNSPDMPGLAEIDDRFGSAVARHDSDGGAVFIGVPDESTLGEYKAGMINSWEPGVGPGPGISQDSAGIVGDSEVKDSFGAALAVYSATGVDDEYVVQVGVPGEDIRTDADAGMVVTLSYHLGDDNRPGEFEGQHGLSADNTAGEVHEGDRFGSAFGVSTTAIGDPVAPPELYVGVPGYAGGGAVVRYLTDGPAELRNQVIGASEDGDAYGEALLQ